MGVFREQRLYAVGRGPGTASRADCRKPGHSSGAWGLGCRLQPRSGNLPSGTGSVSRRGGPSFGHVAGKGVCVGWPCLL